MEILCGKCLLPMQKLKFNAEVTKRTVNETQQNASFKCLHCDYIVVATWETQTKFQNQKL